MEKRARDGSSGDTVRDGMCGFEENLICSRPLLEPKDKDAGNEMVIRHRFVAQQSPYEGLDFRGRGHRAEGNFVRLVVGHCLLGDHELDGVHAVRVVHTHTQERIPLLECSPCPPDVLLAEKTGASCVIGLFHDIAPDDVRGTVEDAIVVEAGLIQPEWPSVGPAGRRRRRADERPGHGEGRRWSSIAGCTCEICSSTAKSGAKVLRLIMICPLVAGRLLPALRPRALTRVATRVSYVSLRSHASVPALWLIVLLFSQPHPPLLHRCFLPTMLRRAPTTPDGRVVDRFQESSRVNKPFKPPTLAVTRDQPQRKRKRVSYKGAQAGSDESGSESEGGPKKKKKTGKDGFERPLDNNIVNYPVFKPKPFDQIARRFTIPEMRNKAGEIIPTVQSNIALGIRPLACIIPRPLHDPMADHAIVLYDPTVDDRETDEERREREDEEAKERALKEAQEKCIGMYNPHKSLKELLGSGKDKKKKKDKVPVVIDPRLCKVLRPHQIEGVKVCSHFLCPDVWANACVAVSVQMYDWHDRREPVWLYHGGRDGPRKDPAMHRPHVDSTQAVTTSRQADHREMHHCVSL